MLIGIHGRAHSGKDTVADFLMDQFPDHRRYSFADPIRDMLAAGLNIPMETMLDPTKKEQDDIVFGKSPRQMMQTLGTEWGREMIDPDIWLKAAISRGTELIIPDVRFENEAEWVRRHGQLLHIERPGKKIKESDHVSENGIKKREQDITIINDGTLDDLASLVKNLTEQLLNR